MTSDSNRALVEGLENIINARDEADHAFPQWVRDVCAEALAALVPTQEPVEGELRACPNPWCTSTTMALPTQFSGGIRTGGWRVLCACGIRTPKYATEAEAIAAWNRRPALPVEDVAGMVGVLAPFAAAGEQFKGPAPDEDMAYPFGLTVGDFREAQAEFQTLSSLHGDQNRGGER